MGRPKNWKPESPGFVAAGTPDVFGLLFDQAREVTVESISGDRMKVTDSDGTAYYVHRKDLHSRKAQAKRNPAKHVATEEIKKAAEDLATKRMETLMTDKKKAEREQFDRIKEGIRILDRAEQFFEEMNGGESDNWNRIRELAEAGLFAEVYAAE